MSYYQRIGASARVLPVDRLSGRGRQRIVHIVGPVRVRVRVCARANKARVERAAPGWQQLRLGRREPNERHALRASGNDHGQHRIGTTANGAEAFQSDEASTRRVTKGGGGEGESSGAATLVQSGGPEAGCDERGLWMRRPDTPTMLRGRSALAAAAAAPHHEHLLHLAVLHEDLHGKTRGRK